MSDIKKNRNIALDYLKFIAVFLVCQTHYKHFSKTLIDNAVGITSSLGVPLFLMVNGMLLLGKPMKSIHKHGLKTLRIFLLCIIWKAITIEIMAVAWRKPVFINGVGPLINYLLGNNTFEGFEAGHFWYLYALVGIYLVFPVISICLWSGNEGNKAVSLILIVELFFAFGLPTWDVCRGMLEHYCNLIIPFELNSLKSFHIMGAYAGCLVWFLLGYYFRKKPLSIRASIIGTIIGWVLLLLINRYQISIGLNANGRVENAYYIAPTLLMGCSAFSLFLRLGPKLPRLHIVEIVSRNSWGIYMLHMITGIVFLKLQYKYHFPLGFLLNTVKSLWMMFASCILVVILKKIPIIRKLV